MKKRKRSESIGRCCSVIMNFYKVRNITFAIIFLVSFLHPYAEESIPNDIYKEGIRKYILKDYKGAIRDFENAYQLNRRDEKIKNMLVNALAKLGNIEYEAGKLDAAERHFVRALKYSGTRPELIDLLNEVRSHIERKIIASNSYRQPQEKVVNVIEKPQRFIAPRANGVLQARLTATQKKLQVVESHAKLLEDQIQALATLKREVKQSSNFITLSILFAILFIAVAVIGWMAIRKLNKSDSNSLSYIDKKDEIEKAGSGFFPPLSSDLEKILSLAELHEAVTVGDLTPEMIETHINCFSRELKTQVLDYADSLLKSKKILHKQNLYHLLMPLITDDDETIRRRSRKLAKKVR